MAAAQSPVNIYTFPQPSLIFAETNFNSVGTITNLGSTDGFTLTAGSGALSFTALHQGAVNKTVADNHWIYNTTYSQNLFSLIFNLTYVTPTANQVQYEAGIWWDSSNRIYYGNNAATGYFVSIKIAGTDVYFDNSFTAQNTNAYVQIVLNRTTNRCTFYTFDTGTNGGYIALANEIDTSAMSVPNTDWTVFYGGGNEKSGRTGGASSNLNFFNAYAGYNNVNPTTL